jgi:tetratricopeptide (TPR) repeat protein
LLLGGTEIPRNQELYPARAWSPVLRVLLWKVPGLAFPFGLLLPLAVVGLGVVWRRAPVLAASAVLLGLAVAAFFVTGRYRAPLLPLLALFAAAGVRWAAVEASVRARTAAGAVAMAVYLLANLGQGPMPLRMNADAEQGLAHWLEREGRPAEALALYEQLAQEAPSSFDAWYGVARLATVLGQRAKADLAMARIRGLEPEFLDTALLLGRAALAAGCGAEADTFTRRAMALDGRSDLARALPGGSGASGDPTRWAARRLPQPGLRGAFPARVSEPRRSADGLALSRPTGVDSDHGFASGFLDGASDVL